MNATKNTTCGCGRVITSDAALNAVRNAQFLVCSVCGAKALPGRVLGLIRDERGCAWCGCPEFHDGEDCPTQMQFEERRARKSLEQARAFMAKKGA